MLCGLIIWWRDSWFDFQLSLDIDICDVLFWGGRDFIMMLFFVTVQDTDKATIYIVSILMEVLRAVAQFEVPVSDRFLSVFCFKLYIMHLERINLFFQSIFISMTSLLLYICLPKKNSVSKWRDKKHFCYVMMCSVKYSLLCRVECIFLGGDPLKSNRIFWNDEI